MNYYLTGDSHFNHANILIYCKRPGLSPEEQKLLEAGTRFRPSQKSIQIMDDYLIDGINKTVKENDVLIHAGDFCFAPKETYYETARKYRNRINCKNVHIVWGNHDKGFVIRDLFSSNHDLYQLNINGQVVVVCHYAMAVWNKSHRGSIHLYGHSHSNAETALNQILPGRRSLDVGVDNAKKLLGEYRPFAFEEIQEILKNNKGCSIDHHQSEEGE